MDLRLWVLILALNFGALSALWRDPGGRIRIYLEGDDRLIIPKHQSELKILSPLTDGDKFYAQLSKIHKKPLKYVKHIPFGKLEPDSWAGAGGGEGKCCGNQWTLDSQEVNLGELLGPVSVPPAYIHKYQNTEDIKPVTEHIEDDLKYDFRTKTHSLR